MFFGFNMGSRGFNRGGGCIFLPTIFICGSCFVFDNLQSGWLIGLLLMGVIWLMLPNLLPNMATRERDFEGDVYEKPKRDGEFEKPKRDTELDEPRYAVGDDGELVRLDRQQDQPSPIERTPPTDTL